MRLRSVSRTPWLTWDLENRPIAYWVPDRPAAEITAIGWKWSDRDEAEALLLTRDGRFLTDAGKRWSAKRAYEFFRGELERASVVVGHNIRRHDLPLFQAGLLRLGLTPLRSVLTTDTLRDYPRRKDMSASLENLAHLYGIDDEGGKKHMSVMDWEQANRLQPDGMALARERVVSDVVLQERLRHVLADRGLLGEPKRWNP